MICPYCGNLITYNSFFDVFYCSKCGGFFKQATVMECNDLNGPLTLDGLRKMDGEPVWVVCLTPEIYDEPPIRWRILEKSIIGTFGVWGNKDSCLTERDYGKTWIAYRQKPEEETV